MKYKFTNELINSTLSTFMCNGGVCGVTIFIEWSFGVLGFGSPWFSLKSPFRNLQILGLYLHILRFAENKGKFFSWDAIIKLGEIFC